MYRAIKTQQKETKQQQKKPWEVAWKIYLALKKVEDRFFLEKKNILYQAGPQSKVLKKILNVFAFFFLILVDNGKQLPLEELKARNKQNVI